tara:strand:- start:145 stop:330 length:186 start_codon:yes stop_codon:yes gene_type:complete
VDATLDVTGFFDLAVFPQLIALKTSPYPEFFVFGDGRCFIWIGRLWLYRVVILERLPRIEK